MMPVSVSERDGVVPPALSREIFRALRVSGARTRTVALEMLRGPNNFVFPLYTDLCYDSYHCVTFTSLLLQIPETYTLVLHPAS